MNKQYVQCVFWLLVWVCCFSTCLPVPQRENRTDDYLVQPLVFEYLKIGATIHYQGQAYQDKQVYINFRIKKDHLIWFSVLVPGGIEIFRGIITTNGITLLNRMQKVYYAYDYAMLYSLWPGPWDYTLLQALLLGELPSIVTTREVLPSNARKTMLQYEKNEWTLTYFIHPLLKKVEKVIATAKQGSWIAVYNQYTSCQGGLFYRWLTLHWYYGASPTHAAVRLTFKRRSIHWPKKLLRFPFSIPAQYEKKEATFS
mmetsp:Transcript_971/g.2377  ORF Transcript_971/g.2377 Transcript_971/m.2377 type:complete len:256 (-) Transcript_971:853-1620(-)